MTLRDANQPPEGRPKSASQGVALVERWQLQHSLGDNPQAHRKDRKLSRGFRQVHNGTSDTIDNSVN
jgi:hypothetical protein